MCEGALRLGDAEGVLCVDATNALNRELHVALSNILHLCPSFGSLLINTYQFDCFLFIDHNQGRIQENAMGVLILLINNNI